jgi:ABC-type branched-subunit amino acid transport system substrate-binding protein
MASRQQWTRMVSVALLGSAIVLSGCAQKSKPAGGTAAAPTAAAPGAAKNPVKIGFVNPLSGDSATYGQMGKRAIDIALPA